MPHAAVGFYGYPENYYYPCATGDAQCGYNDPAAGPSLRALNDAQARIFAASSGLFPSIYLPTGTNHSSDFAHKAEYVSSGTAEAARVRAAYSPNAVVLPFAWNFYHDGHTLLLPEGGSQQRLRASFPHYPQPTVHPHLSLRLASPAKRHGHGAGLAPRVWRRRRRPVGRAHVLQ